MKRILFICTLILCVLCPINLSAGNFWKTLGRIFGGIAESAGGAIIQQSCVSQGYSQEESAKMTRDFMETLGANTQNVDRGLAYMNASDRYERQNIVKDVVFDFVGEVSDNPKLVEKFRQITDAQVTYLSERGKAMTDEERQAAFDKRTRAYADILYDTYQEVKDARAKHLAEKMRIKQKLIEQGYDSDMAVEVAGNILAIQNSKMSTQEKERLLQKYEFIGSPREIQNNVAQVLQNNDTENMLVAQKLEEAERQRKLEEEQKEAERRAAEERKQAIEKMTSIIPDYQFDVVELSDTQKQQLDEVAQILQKYSDVSILLTGHTCKVGYKNINMKKGLQRANLAKEYLVEKGVAEHQIQVDSKGELEPIAENNTREGRAQNRRIEISILSE